MFKHSGKPRHIQPPVEGTHFSRAMVELGIQQIFARSTQAKGRVERAAGTFQDRLVTELRLAGASTIDQANAVLEGFLPRYNAQFAVPAEMTELAYRPRVSQQPLDEVLCFNHLRKVARDNTVKYQWRSLQFLPGAQRPNYAGARVEVLEHPVGQLQVRHEGEIIPSQPAPARPGALRAAYGGLAPNPEISRIVKRLGNHRLSQPMYGTCPTWSPVPSSRNRRWRTANANPKLQERPLSPRQLALWKAIQQARTQGFGLLAIARRFGISRNTVRKYARSLIQATNRPNNRGRRPSPPSTHQPANRHD